MCEQVHLTADEMGMLQRGASARQARNDQAQSVDKMIARGDSYDPIGLHLMGLMGEYALLVRLFGLPYTEDYFVRDQWAKTHDFSINGVRGEIRTRTHARYLFYNLTAQMRSDVGVAAYLVDGKTSTGRVAFAGWLTQAVFARYCYVARDRHPGWRGGGYLVANRHLQPIGSLWDHLHADLMPPLTVGNGAVTAAPCDLCAWFDRMMTMADESRLSAGYDRWQNEKARHLAKRHPVPRGDSPTRAGPGRPAGDVTR